MKKEILDLLAEDNGVRTFKILGFPTMGKMRISLAEGNTLGADDVTVDRPAELNEAKVGQKFKVIGDEGDVTYAGIALPTPKADKPQDKDTTSNRRTPNTYQVSGVTQEKSEWD